MSVAPPLARSAFDLEPEIVWALHCAEGPVPIAAAEAVRRFLERETRPWTLRFDDDFVGIPQRARREIARVLGASVEDVTLTATTSTGLVTVARALPWKPGDEVVVPLGEFPSNAWPWIALDSLGVGFRETPLWDGHRAGEQAWASTPPPDDVDPEARLLEALGPRTRVLSASWVRFQDGLRLDLGRLSRGCRERNVHLVVDGIQGAGTLPVPLAGVDAFASGGHKGLLAPQGIGVLWTSPSFRGVLAPAGSWLSVEEATDFRRPSTDLRRRWTGDGTRLEQGVPNLLGALALAESAALLHAAGVEAIARHVDRLEARLLARLVAGGSWAQEAVRLERLRAQGRLGSIVALHHAGRGAERLARLLEEGTRRGIHASVREGYLRVALHGYSDDADVERIAAWLESDAA